MNDAVSNFMVFIIIMKHLFYIRLLSIKIWMNDSRLVSELLKATKILEVRSQDREVIGLVMCHGTNRHSLYQKKEHVILCCFQI